MQTGKFVTDWVIKAVKENYAEDIALIVAHDSLRIDEGEPIMNYFVPITDKGRLFARTFILEGKGFDIWGIEWERLEGFSNLMEYNTTCLADGEILYARTPADKERFEGLKKRLAENLANPELRRARALEAFAQARQIFLQMLFAKGSDVKLGAGYVMDYLARAIAFSHGGYFKKAQTDQIAELLEMGGIPAGFEELYSAIIRQKDEVAQKQQCYEMIGMVGKFLMNPQPPQAEEHNFQDLADWYGELSYTWLRIRHYCAAGDAVKAFMWGIMLQDELNHVCADFGLPKMELMAAYDSGCLSQFSAHAGLLEKEMRQRITDGGGIIHEYQSREGFLNEI